METPLPPSMPTEIRYDNATLHKIVTLAGQLQGQHSESLTAQEIETIGVEVGLEPLFIQQALAQLTTSARKPPIRRVPVQRRGKAVWRIIALIITFVLLWVASECILHLFGIIGWFAVMALCAGVGYQQSSRKFGFWMGVVLTVTLSIPDLAYYIATHASGFNPMHTPSGTWGTEAQTTMGVTLLIVLFVASLVGRSGALGGWLRRRKALKTEEVARQNTTGKMSRAALLQTLFSLQAQLQSHMQHSAFLSVDVVQSSQIKRAAAELAVEYSFGQLRAWVESIAAQHGGQIQIAAGDGMMCLFPSDEGAVRTARQLQQQIGQFNQRHNHMNQPIQIRCGLSAGQVAIEPDTPIGHLQSPVIDRAARLQKQAQPNGIALGAELAAPALVELGNLHPTVEVATGEQVFTWQPGYMPTAEAVSSLTLQSES